MSEPVCDVTMLRQSDKIGSVLALFDELTVGQSLVLINNRPLDEVRCELDREYPGSYRCRLLDNGPRSWRARLTKLTTTPLPRAVADTDSIGDFPPSETGSMWVLPGHRRDLDAAVVDLVPGAREQLHTGPAADTLVYVVAGSGSVLTERGEVFLRPGTLVLLPRGAQHGFTAGPDGLRYLSVQPHPEQQVPDWASPW